MAPASKKVTKIVVYLGRQKLFAYSGNQQIFEFNCVIGREGHATDPGSFKIRSKERMHLSHAYNDAKMPFTMFFSSDGKAIHGTPLAELRSFAGALGLGSVIPAVGSHGCVGLANEQAGKLYDLTPTGTPVTIVQ